jgi:translation initiation factor RLI1
VCEEHCPTLPKKAIRFKEEIVTNEFGVEKKIKQPFVDEELCIGCAICENKCPLEKQAGIIVFNQKKIMKEGFFVSGLY